MENDNGKHTRPATAEERDAVIGKAMVRALAVEEPGGECCTAGEIAALVDNALNGEQRDRIMGHLAACRRCYAIYSLAHGLHGSEATDTVAYKRRTRYALSGALAVAAAALLAGKFTLAPAPEHPARTVGQGQPEQRVAAAPSVAATDAGERADIPKPAPPARKAAPEPAVLALLIDEEAARPGAKSFGFAGHAADNGPAISVQDLEITGDKPFRLVIGFAPWEGAGIDLATLKVVCLKAEPIDLTPRLRPYAGAQGIRAERVRLPEGMYRFRVSVNDYQGRLSEKDFSITVSYKF